jgi:L-alanine-DL-glutamate epimerase-like enolase superfamily enzyme
MGEQAMLTLETTLMNVQLTEPFRISRGVQHYAQRVVVHIQAQGQVGLGEAAPSTFYGENHETVLACLSAYAGHLGDDPFALEEILTKLEQTIHRNAAARAAVDMALYDLTGKLLGVPVYKLLGLNPAKTPYTSFTEIEVRMPPCFNWGMKDFPPCLLLRESRACGMLVIEKMFLIPTGGDRHGQAAPDT